MDISKIVVFLDWILRMANKLLISLGDRFGVDLRTTTTEVAETTTVTPE